MNRGILTINKNGKKRRKNGLFRLNFWIEFVGELWCVGCRMIEFVKLDLPAPVHSPIIYWNRNCVQKSYSIRSFLAFILMFVRTFSLFAANCDIGQAWTLWWERRKDLSFVCIRSVGLRTRKKINEASRQVTTKTNGEHECVADCANMHTMPIAKNEKR